MHSNHFKIKNILFVLLMLMVTECCVAQSGNMSSSKSGALQQTTPGEFFDDSAITTQIKIKFLADSDIKSLNISVSTDKGVVSLRGVVENTAEKKQAIDLARSVNGVKMVKDELVVRNSH